MVSNSVAATTTSNGPAGKSIHIDAQYFDGYTSLRNQQVQYTLSNGAANPQGGGIVWWINSGHVVSVDTNSSSGNGVIDVLQLSPSQIDELGLRDGALDDQL